MKQCKACISTVVFATKRDACFFIFALLELNFLGVFSLYNADKESHKREESYEKTYY